MAATTSAEIAARLSDRHFSLSVSRLEIVKPRVTVPRLASSISFGATNRFFIGTSPGQDRDSSYVLDRGLGVRYCNTRAVHFLVTAMRKIFTDNHLYSM